MPCSNALAGPQTHHPPSRQLLVHWGLARTLAIGFGPGVGLAKQLVGSLKGKSCRILEGT